MPPRPVAVVGGVAPEGAVRLLGAAQVVALLLAAEGAAGVRAPTRVRRPRAVLPHRRRLPLLRR